MPPATPKLPRSQLDNSAPRNTPRTAQFDVTEDSGIHSFVDLGSRKMEELGAFSDGKQTSGNTTRRCSLRPVAPRLRSESSPRLKTFVASCAGPLELPSRLLSFFFHSPTIASSGMLGFPQEMPCWSSTEPISSRIRRLDSPGESARAQIAEPFGICWRELS